MTRILNVCRLLITSRRAQKVVFHSKVFPLTFWLMNILELEQRNFFREKGRKRVESFVKNHLLKRMRLFLSIQKKLIRETNVFRRETNISNPKESFCHHCGQCCFIFGGLNLFPESWPFPTSWKSFFTDGIGKHHLFCAFLFESNLSGKSFCAIHQWRPLVCGLFGEEECRFYLESPHLPLSYLGIIKSLYKSIFPKNINTLDHISMIPCRYQTTQETS